MVVAVITYLSLIAGELDPKHIGLRNAERVAAAVANRGSEFNGRPNTAARSTATTRLQATGSKLLWCLTCGKRPLAPICLD